MFLLELTESFSAAHALRNYPGVCARTHGHNWTVRVRLTASSLDENGMTADYAILREKLTGLLSEFDHTTFNDHPYFQSVNPTSENIARYIFDRLGGSLPGVVTLHEVEIAETPGFSVTYRP